MPNSPDPHAVNAVQHEPRVPGAEPDEQEKRDHPNKPFRTPNKTKTHPAPETATDGDPRDREPKTT